MLNQLKQWAIRDADIELVYLFGSVAAGLADAESDIDLAIKTKTPLNAEKKIKLIEELAQLTGRAVDLIDLNTAGEPLLGEIIKGIRLKGSDEGHAELLSRHLIDSADFLPLVRRILAERREKWIN